MKIAKVFLSVANFVCRFSACKLVNIKSIKGFLRIGENNMKSQVGLRKFEVKIEVHLFKLKLFDFFN